MKESLSEVQQKVSEIQQRLATVEQRRLSELLDDWSDLGNWSDPGLAQSQIVVEPRSSQRGRKPKIDLEELWLLRGGIVNMLEDYWPEIQPFFSNPKKLENIRKVLEVIADPRHGHNSARAKHLLRHLGTLLEFLSSDRYRGDPRQVANAMAGIDEVSWWRSLKVCGAHPCPMAIGERARRHYISRKFPKIALLLDGARNSVEVGSILRRYRSRDPLFQLMKDQPEYALRMWKEGQTDMRRLRP